MGLLFLAWTLLVVLLGCSSPLAYSYASEPDPRGKEYIIGVADSLSIRVWGNNELNTDATVRPDGTFTMPLVGDVPAAGYTPTQVKRAIARVLAAYIKDRGAVVTVAVTQTSYRVAVSGNVARPGVFEARRYLTVSEAMALAGGPNRFASSNDAVIIRAAAKGRGRRIPIQYEEIEAGRHPEQDLVLLSGDRIFVP